MFKYLGVGSEDYNRHVFSNNLRVVFEHSFTHAFGEFTGYSCVVDNVEGFAYYNHLGDFYEFASLDECSLISSNPLIIGQLKFILKEDALNILKYSRSESNYVSLFEIHFYNKHLKPVQCNGHLVNYLGKKSFLIHDSSNSGEKYCIIDMDDCLDYSEINDVLFLMSEEIEQRNKILIKEKYDEYLDKIKSLKLSIKEDFINDKHIYYAIDFLIENNIYSFNFDGDFTKSEFITLFYKLKSDVFKYKTNQELSQYGIKVLILNDFDNVLSLSIVDNKNNLLSKMSINKCFFKSQLLDFKRSIHIDFSDRLDILMLDLNNESELDNKSIDVFENEKHIKLENSKFLKLYELFDKNVFILNKDLINIDDFKELPALKNEYELTKETSEINIFDQHQVNLFILKSIKKNRKLSLDLRGLS